MDRDASAARTVTAVSPAGDASSGVVEIGDRADVGSGARMHVLHPTGALEPFVENIWYYRTAGFSHARERILPTGAMQLLVNLDEDELRTYLGEGYRSVARLPGAALCGAYTGAFAIDTLEQRAIAGVTFRSGGAFPFFQPPADEIAGAHVGLGDLWGRDGSSLRERLLEARTPAAILATLEQELLGRARKPLAADRGIEFAVRAFDLGAPVAAVVARFGGSSRRFLRAFAEHVGLTPKRFSRVRRFRRVLGSIEMGRPPDWAQLALRCGYFDQAHLINDFREFSGLTPTAYVPRSPDERSHVPLRDESAR